MKRLIALVLAGLMVLGGASFAAEWPQGCSPAQPYSHLPEVNLSETMGYIMMFPRTKLPAARFCDVLQMYLPRTDLKLGEGTVRLYENVEGEKEPVEICKVDFTDADSVKIREMSEKELQSFMWGSGSCVQMGLSKSLEFVDKVHDYYVLMDEGCFTANEGKLKSISITSKEAWVPAIGGDYGVSGLYYVDAPLEVKAEESAPLTGEDAEIEELPNGGIELIEVVPEEAEEGEEGEEEEEEEPEITEAPRWIIAKRCPSSSSSAWALKPLMSAASLPLTRFSKPKRRAFPAGSKSTSSFQRARFLRAPAWATAV